MILKVSSLLENGKDVTSFLGTVNDSSCSLAVADVHDLNTMCIRDREYTAQKLRELCQRAGKYIIGVEPMPYSGIPDVKKGWAVVKAADCENAKLILDTWHWVRANQPIELSVLEGIPADKIVSIQINDVWERPYATTILRDESMHDRLAPGTGIGTTVPFVKMIREKGIKPNAIGVEAVSYTHLLQLAGKGEGQIDVAFLRTLGVDFVPKIIRNFLTANEGKQINFNLFCDKVLTGDILTGLKEKKYDIGFCSKRCV